MVLRGIFARNTINLLPAPRPFRDLRAVFVSTATWWSYCTFHCYSLPRTTALEIPFKIMTSLTRHAINLEGSTKTATSIWRHTSHICAISAINTKQHDTKFFRKNYQWNTLPPSFLAAVFNFYLYEVLIIRTALLVGRSPDRFPVVSLGIFFRSYRQNHVPWWSTQPLKMSTRDFSWGKDGRCVRLTTYHPRRAERQENPGP